MPKINAQVLINPPGPQSICQDAGQGSQNNVREKVGVKDRTSCRPVEAQVSDHLGQDNTIA